MRDSLCKGSRRKLRWQHHKAIATMYGGSIHTHTQILKKEENNRLWCSEKNITSTSISVSKCWKERKTEKKKNEMKLNNVAAEMLCAVRFCYIFFCLYSFFLVPSLLNCFVSLWSKWRGKLSFTLWELCNFFFFWKRHIFQLVSTLSCCLKITKRYKFVRINARQIFIHFIFFYIKTYAHWDVSCVYVCLCIFR